MSKNRQKSQVADFPLVKADDTEHSALTAVVRRLSSARTLAEVMNIVTHGARVLLGADGITFVLRENDQCFYAEEDAISPLWKGRRFPLDACISGWCMKHAKPAAVRDIYQDERIPKDAYQPTFVRSLAMVPVQQDDPIAALGAYWATPRTIQPREVDVLRTMANAAALAVAYVELQRQVQDRPEAQAQTMVNQEAEHRLRNMSSTVQSVVKQSLRDDPERAALISKRIETLLAPPNMDQSDDAYMQTIRDVLAAELEPYGPSRMTLSGDEVHLPQDHAKVLAAVVHEWATNASKYGAFSVPKGRLSVSWVATDNDIRLVWEELDGPEVVDLGRKGFGSHFVSHVINRIGGTVETDLGRSGIVNVLRLPTQRR